MAAARARRRSFPNSSSVDLRPRLRAAFAPKVFESPFMSASIRALIDTVADIGTAVRASREYSRLSLDARAMQADRLANSAFLPK
jgi:hypothetical protein